MIDLKQSSKVSCPSLTGSRMDTFVECVLILSILRSMNVFVSLLHMLQYLQKQQGSVILIHLYIWE